MSEDLSYRRPVLFDQDTGAYVTATQIKFFLNKKNAITQIKNKTSEFSEYIDFCKFYNFFWDITTHDPNQGFMFWDHEAETIAFQFPAKGKVAKYLSTYNK
tara:strand:- start:401 stop:703 length:303 start_codon:yes stop_codon:yes gene_type:complete